MRPNPILEPARKSRFQAAGSQKSENRKADLSRLPFFCSLFRELSKRLLLAFLLLLLLPPLAAEAQEVMTCRRMEDILRREASQMEGESGSWMLYYGERLLLALADTASNRMRVFTPIVERKLLSPATMERMLEANFYTALDAKYGLYEGFVVSVFTHPLAELTEARLIDGLQQVVRLADTFGSTYSSSNLFFGNDPAAEPDRPEEGKRINQRPTKGKGM